MITFDPNKLTPIEVELMEYTVTERVAPLRKTLELPPRIYTLADIRRAFDAMREGAAETNDGVPMGIVLRVIELVDMRKTNPAAVWEDTGKVNLVAEVDTETAPEVLLDAAVTAVAAAPEAPVWPTPTTPV